MRPMRRFILTCLAVLSVLTLVWPVPGQGGYIKAQKERYNLFVFGDKMATGLLAGLWRVLSADGPIRARGRMQVGSGLARPQLYDWNGTLPGILDTNKVDIAVVMLGVNDAREIRSGGVRVLFGTDQWRNIYAARVRRLIAHFTTRGIPLYWVGLPPVRDEGRNEALKYVAEIIEKEVKAAGAKYIPVYRAFATADGRYTDRFPDESGKVVRMRARNGVHFIKAGNTRLASIVAKVLLRDVAEAGPDEPEAPEVIAAEDGKDAITGPVMGHRGPLGQVSVVAASELPGEGAATITAMTRVLHSRQRIPPPDSPAQRLFIDGEWPRPPSGRADDFSLPPELKADASQAR